MTNPNPNKETPEQELDARDLETKLRQDLGMTEWQIRDLLPIISAHHKAREANHARHKGESHYFHTADDQSGTGSAGVRLVCKCGATRVVYDQETHDFLARSLTVDDKKYQRCPNCGTPVLLSKGSQS